MVSPFSIGLTMMCCTRDAYSDWFSEPRRVRDLPTERCLGVLRKTGQQRGLEQAGRDGDHPHLSLGQFPGDRQRHPDDAALGRRVGGLADLAVEGGDGSGVHDHPALLAVQVRRQHPFRGEPGDIEGADQVHLDDLAEQVEGKRAVLADHFGRRADPGTVDQDPQRLAGPVRQCPARRSRRPGSVTSAGAKRAWSPNRSATAAPADCGRSRMTTAAPAAVSISAVARPEPGCAAGDHGRGP